MPPTAPPSIYDSMAKMSMAKGSPSPASAKGKDDASGGGSMEEKKQILTTLLEVFKKWDKLESDESGKKIIADMVKLAEQYKSQVLKDSSGDTSASPTEPPPSAGAASSDMGMTGAGAGAGGSSKMAVPA